MIDEPTGATPPTPEELRAACHTLLGMPGANLELTTKLQYVANLLADVGPLDRFPLLVWREANQDVRHACIGNQLIVGRAPEPAGLSFPDDRLLSRNHFSVTLTEDGCWLRDFDSKNGTAVNAPNESAGERLLRDGDLIFAGNHIFAFLAQTEVFSD
jgi:hypothetical protein